MVLFNTIDVYTAIKLNWLSVAWVAQWIEHVILHTYILSSALLVRILHATFIFVTTLKTFVLIFIQFSPFAKLFLHFN